MENSVVTIIGRQADILIWDLTNTNQVFASVIVTLRVAQFGQEDSYRHLNKGEGKAVPLQTPRAPGG